MTKKSVPIIVIIVSFASLLLLTACNNPNHTLNIEPKQAKQIVPEEKRKILKNLAKAIQQKDYETFGNVLAEIYKNGWPGDPDFKRAESYLYTRGTLGYHEGHFDKVLNMANIIFPKVYESWRFKYLKIISLEKLGRQALEKGDLAKAEDYARQILSIEFRQEGTNLLAEVYIKQAEIALKAGDKAKARSILMQSNGMEITAELQKKIDELRRKLQ